jgi:glycosyltransferase involved in cell wall biosynthesis
VFRQTFKEYEVIVIDDGSTDETGDVVSRFGPLIRYIRQPHSGVAAARNRGITQSRGDLIAFLDADDLWLEEMLAALVPLFDDLTTAVATADNYRWDQRRAIEQSPRKWQRKPHPADHEDLWTRLLHTNTISPSTTVVRRVVLQAVGLFDETLTHASDYELWLRIVRAGYRVRFIDRPLGVIRLDSANMSNDRGPKYDAHLRVWSKLLALPDLAPESRRLILQNRRTTNRSFGKAAAAYALQGQVGRSRTYFLKACYHWPYDLRNLLGLILTWAAPGVAVRAAQGGVAWPTPQGQALIGGLEGSMVDGSLPAQARGGAAQCAVPPPPSDGARSIIRLIDGRLGPWTRVRQSPPGRSVHLNALRRRRSAPRWNDIVMGG